MTTIFIDDEPHYWADGPPGAFVPLAEADALEAQIAALTAERDSLREALEEIAAGNPAPPGKWLTDIQMAEIARRELDKSKPTRTGEPK